MKSQILLVTFFIVLVVSPFFSDAAPSMMGLKVQGNRIVNKDGVAVRLFGVNRSGMEFMCIQGYGFFDGPSNQSSIDTMKTWKINAVRVPLNEDCWLNINGVDQLYGGQNYISAVKGFVDLLTSNGLAVILDLHWTGDGSTKATKQAPMPDLDHAPDFWKGLSATFGSYSNVIFDIFNEPYPDNNNWDSTAGWTCWRDGVCPSSINYKVAGMQTLVTTVRDAGAKNILMLGGLAYSNSLAQWLQYMPKDPSNNLAASVHIYNFNYCSSTTCYDKYIAPVNAKVPVIIGEFGQDNCQTDFVNTVMTWADTQSISYLGWTWNTWDCGSGPSLIVSFNGTATNYGLGLKNHLAIVNP